MNSQPSSPQKSLSLGSTYGYRIDAEEIELQATVTLLDASAYDATWKLQLWACATPEDAASLIGHLVAETALPTLADWPDSNVPVFLRTAPTFPIGREAYTMVLALVAVTDGQTSQVHDSAIFADSQRFELPRFTGPLTVDETADHLAVHLAGIENPRPSDTRSGTLSLEVWSIGNDYTGGDFSGTPLTAANILGALAGQSDWSNLSVSLARTAETPADIALTVMLREWNGAAFVTRDFVQIPSVAPCPSASDSPAPESIEPTFVVDSLDEAPVEEPPVDTEPAPAEASNDPIDETSVEFATEPEPAFDDSPAQEPEPDESAASLPEFESPDPISPEEIVTLTEPEISTIADPEAFAVDEPIQPAETAPSIDQPSTDPVMPEPIEAPTAPAPQETHAPQNPPVVEAPQPSPPPPPTGISLSGSFESSAPDYLRPVNSTELTVGQKLKIAVAHDVASVKYFANRFGRSVRALLPGKSDKD